MSDLLKTLQLLGDAEIDDLSIAHDALEEIVGLRMRLAAAEADAGRLHLALETLISVAEKCDGWESFPSDALDAAIDAARGAK